MGDKVILQIVPQTVGKILEIFEGETIIEWKNLSLKRLEDQDVCIWQMIDQKTGPSQNHTTGYQREIDPSVFLPQIDVTVIFYEIKEKNVLVEWLRAIGNDPRLKNTSPIIVGCYQKGENTNKFKELFNGESESRVFLWQIDCEEILVDIYQQILLLI